MLSHRVGTTREGSDGRPRLVRSDDGGATWRVLASPFVGALPAGWDLRGCALAETADGGLVAVVVALDKTVPRPAAVQPGHRRARHRSEPRRAIRRRRRDVVGAVGAGGRPPRPAREPGSPRPSPTAVSCARSRRSRRTTTPGPGATPAACCDPTTADGRGDRRSISAASDPDGDPHDTMWWDPRIARLASGELVQCYYAFRHATRTEGPVHIAWSPDDGATWTAPTSTGLPGPGDLSPAPPRRPTASSSSNVGPRRKRWSRSSRTTAAVPSTGPPS